jgi:hypothetical protein
VMGAEPACMAPCVLSCIAGTLDAAAHWITSSRWLHRDAALGRELVQGGVRNCTPAKWGPVVTVGEGEVVWGTEVWWWVLTWSQWLMGRGEDPEGKVTCHTPTYKGCLVVLSAGVPERCITARHSNPATAAIVEQVLLSCKVT